MNALDWHGVVNYQGWRMMSEQDYLNAILARELVGSGLASPALFVPGVIRPVIEQWVGRFLLDVTASGSYAKGTANRSGTDLDLFISLSPDTAETLSEVHKTLAASLKAAGYQPPLQNVSIGINVRGYSVDLVPGKRQNWLFSDHSLYKRRGDTWTKTDVSQHITKVKDSGRQAEIRLAKLWRTQKGLEFPSFYLTRRHQGAGCHHWPTNADGVRVSPGQPCDGEVCRPLKHQQHHLGRSHRRREAGH